MGRMVNISSAEYAIYKSDFVTLDVNGNGVLEGPEIEQLLAVQLGHAPDPADVTNFMNEFDSNGNGRISFEEYMSLILDPDFEVGPSIAAKAELNQAMDTGSTPLYIAAQKNSTDCAQLLIAAKAELNQAENDGCTPLYIAAQENSTECAQLLIAAKAELNQAANNGVTPIGIAASNGHLDAVRLLVSSGAAVNPAPDNWGDTPLSEARAEGHSEIVEILVAAGAK